MKKLLSLIAILFIGIIIITSCERDERVYQMRVIVSINDSIRAPNVLVHVYAPVDGTFIDYYDYTNENGEAPVMKFNNKVIVEITAARGPFKGCGFAEVERGPQDVYINITDAGEPDNGCLSDI